LFPPQILHFNPQRLRFVASGSRAPPPAAKVRSMDAATKVRPKRTTLTPPKESAMNSIKVTAAIAAVTTTLVLGAALGALIQKAENEAFASVAKTEFVAQTDRTVVVVTRAA
jgi:hypothetical protein